jgi:hypothetical protein
MRLLLLLCPVVLLRAQSSLDLAVLGSRAQSFAESLTNLVCTETLRQRELRYESRLRIRRDDNVLVAPPPKILQREIVSDLGYALDGADKPIWREVRKVIRVDSKAVTTQAKARERLLFGLRSNRDRDRQRLLAEFTRHGLDVTVTDYGLSLLLFLPAELPKYDFLPDPDAKEEFSGADRLRAFRFRRRDQEANVTVFDGKKVTHAPLEGRLWVKQSDSTPVRIQLLAATQDEEIPILDDGTVEYAPSRFGPLVVSSVRFVRRVSGRNVAEADYQYTNHQKFGADAELKFETVPEDPKP